MRFRLTLANWPQSPAEGRNIFLALGSTVRTVSVAELEKRMKFRRRAILARPMKEGDIIRSSDLKFLRPGTGIRPDEISYIVGRRSSPTSTPITNWSGQIWCDRGSKARSFEGFEKNHKTASAEAARRISTFFGLPRARALCRFSERCRQDSGLFS